MRYALLCGLALVAGCGKLVSEPTPSVKGIPPETGSGASPLPTPTANLRVNASDLRSFYDNQVFEEKPKKHQHEGKRAIIQAGWDFDLFGIQASNGQRMFLANTRKMFTRPSTVYILRAGSEFRKGERNGNSGAYLEGVIRGAVRFDSKPWAKDWLELAAQRTGATGEHFLLIEDAVLVAEPKD